MDRRVVWIVDDAPLDLERSRSILTASYDVETFRDGSAVLERIAGGQTPDVLVLDWVMPGITGLEVCRFLRRSGGQASNLSTLLLTAKNATDQVVEGLDAGANDYLAKPFAEQELLARVGALVRGVQLLERAEQAEANVRRLLANAPNALLAISDGRVTFANEEAVRVLGRTEEELMGQVPEALLPGLPLQAFPLGPGPVPYPLPDLELLGRVYAPSLRVLSSDAVNTTTLSLHDVTERRRAETRRLDFYSIIAHDLRSPLTSMLLRTDLILRGKHGVLRPELLEDLGKFGGNIRTMVAMINDFLDLARLEGTGYRLSQEELDLVRLIGGLLEEFRPLLEAGRLTLHAEGLAGELWLAGDRSRLRQVLSNLVGNAIKFTPAGGDIWVRVTSTTDGVRVEVSDTGHGIAPDALESIFQRYARATESKHQISGSGLGLMIVREIVEAHGGQVGVRSELGAGSTFWFELPRQPSPWSRGYRAEPLSPSPQSH